MKRYDLIIIGGGAAGFAAATKANDLGAKTLLVNSGLPVGGTCVNVGCVPSKLLLEMAYDYLRQRKPRFKSIRAISNNWLEFKDIIAEKDRIIESLRKRNYIEVLKNFKTVEYIEGRAKFKSKNEVIVDGETYFGEKFIIATGSSPKVLPFKGIKNVRYLTNREALSLDYLPESMIVIGAGPLGLEFAQMFAMFGTRVYVLEKEKRILPLEEPQISNVLQKSLERYNMEFYTGIDVIEVRQNGDRKFIKFRYGDDEIELGASELLFATGVVPNTGEIELKNAGVNVDERGFIKVDAELKTTADNIWAGGDCVGRMFLETVAAKEGNVAATNALEGKHLTIDYESIPRAVFTFPQVASVGITEEELMKRLNVCACRIVPFSSVPKALAVRKDDGIIKMIVNPHDATIAGVHIVSHNASEIIHEATLAVKFKLKVYDIIDTVHVFPTFSEAIKIAALAFTRDVSVMSCCII
jgi:mercuric reductase